MTPPKEHLSDDDLAQVSAGLTREVRALRSQVASEKQARRRLWWPIVGLLLAVLALGLLFWNQRNIALANRKILNGQTQEIKQVDRTLDIVQRAVDPNSDIGKEAQKNSQQLINQLICDNHRLHGDPHPVINGVPLNC